MVVLWNAVLIVIVVTAVIMNFQEAKIGRMKILGKCDWCPGAAMYYVKIERKAGTEYGICCRDCYDISMGRVRLTEEEIELYKVLKT